MSRCRTPRAGISRVLAALNSRVRAHPPNPPPPPPHPTPPSDLAGRISLTTTNAPSSGRATYGSLIHHPCPPHQNQQRDSTLLLLKIAIFSTRRVRSALLIYASDALYHSHSSLCCPPPRPSSRPTSFSPRPPVPSWFRRLRPMGPFGPDSDLNLDRPSTLLALLRYHSLRAGHRGPRFVVQSTTDRTSTPGGHPV